MLPISKSNKEPEDESDEEVTDQDGERNEQVWKGK